MILATFKNNDYAWMETFNTWEEYQKKVFDPCIDVLFITDFKIKGKTYQERKAYLQDIAINYSNNQAFGLSWGEVAEIQDKFYKLGIKYGLLKEFKENCII